MRFSALDGWRGVCALLVALLHLNAAGHFFFVPFVRNSYLFVDFFFVLSGFVITHAYWHRLGDGKSLRTFVTRRFGRLWPLHVAMLAPLILLELAALAVQDSFGDLYPRHLFTEGMDPAALITNVLLANSFGIHDMLTWNGPSWSIGAEFYTYLVFAAVCFLAPRRLVPISILLVLGGAAVVAVFSEDYIDATYDYGFYRCLYGFFTGHLVYRLYRRFPLSTPRRLPAVVLLEVAVLVLVVAFVSVSGYRLLSMAAPLVFGAAVFVFAFEYGPISSVLGTEPFALLGAWSYSIYMVHRVVMFVINRGSLALEKLTGLPLRTDVVIDGTERGLIFFINEYAMDVVALLYLVAVIAIASLTYRFIELPGQRFFNAFAVRRERRYRSRAEIRRMLKDD